MHYKTSLLKIQPMYCSDNMYMYLSTPIIHELPSLILTYTKCPLFLVHINALYSSIHTKSSTAYNLTCVIDTALKLLSVISQGLYFSEKRFG